jgi:hypothetical protein
VLEDVDKGEDAETSEASGKADDGEGLGVSWADRGDPVPSDQRKPPVEVLRRVQPQANAIATI